MSVLFLATLTMAALFVADVRRELAGR